jgi:hypothetical protein
MHYSKVHIMQKERDPLNLGSLPLLTPPSDDWPLIRSALVKQQRRRRLTQYTGGLLAVAAMLMLAVGLFIHQPALAPPSAPANATATAATTAPQTLDSLITLSQRLETRVRTFRSEAGGIPTESLVYQVELEDLIAQVDGELSMRPDSLELWSQRVNLLLDLSTLYQNQLRRDYHAMASL